MLLAEYHTLMITQKKGVHMESGSLMSLVGLALVVLYMRIAPIGSYIWALGSQLLELFGKD